VRKLVDKSIEYTQVYDLFNFFIPAKDLGTAILWIKLHFLHFSAVFSTHNLWTSMCKSLAYNDKLLILKKIMAMQKF